MDAEEKLGKITVAVGSVCLRFKQEAEAPPPQGHVFVKCSFVGRGGPLFVPATPGDGEAPAAVDIGAGSQSLPPPPSVKSEAVDIFRAVATSPAKDGGETAIGDASEQDAAVADGAVADAAQVVVVDVSFSLDTIKFDLAEPALSMLDATEIKIELCFQSVGAGEDAETVIGTASVRVASILRGNNEWTDDLTLGTYAAGISEDTAAEGKGEADDTPTAEAVDNSDDLPATDAAVAAQDVSPGPLEFGGSTSTVRVTLLTNDDTADYTVGAGSLWADGAEVTGLPEGWKIVPPPETERSAWNDSIAQILAAQPQYEYSICYEPDEESDNGASAAGDSAEDAGSQGQASGSGSSSRGAPSRASAGGSGEGELAPPAPWDPPTGTWSVRFPSFQTKSAFLHRTSIRELRRALSTPRPRGSNGETHGGDGPGSEGGKTATTTTALLPVFLERRELRPEPAADEGKTGGKNAKKGGGGKKPPGKKGDTPEQPPRPPETPWICRAVIDLSPLAQPRAEAEGGARGERGADPAVLPSGAAGCAGNKTAAGDSPMREELRATLTLAPPPSGNDAGHVAADSNPTKGESTDIDGDAGESPTVNEEEERTEQMRASETTLFLTFALSRPLVKATTRQETTVLVSDVLVPSDVGPRKPLRDVDVELKEELDAFVNASLAEYAKLFLEPGAEASKHEQSQTMSAEDREKHLFYALNSGGLYHSFLERLKPRVQRIVRKRFGAVPSDAAEADAFISDLYVHLVEEAAVVLNHRIKNVETKATPCYITADADVSLAERVEHLGMLADDAEARGAREEAAARHEDRIEAATAAAASLEEWRPLLAQSWEGYGLFSLRSGRSGQHGTGDNGDANGDGGTGKTLAHAARCLEESLRVHHPRSDGFLAVMSVLAAVSVEQGQLDRAWALLETALEQRLPKLEEGADGWVPGVSWIGWAIVSDDEPGAPRRTPVRVMQDACAWLLDLGLPGMARKAFKVAAESERLAVKKAKERGLPTRSPTSLRESTRRLQCYLTLAEVTTAASTVDNSNASPPSLGAVPSKGAGLNPEAQEHEAEASGPRDMSAPDQEYLAHGGGVGMVGPEVAAERLAQEAVELAPGDPRPWQALAEACDAQGPVKATEAADAWAAVLDRMEEAWMASSNGDSGRRKSTAPAPPLRVFMRLGSLYTTLGRIDEAKACYLRACRVWRAPGPWLGCGAACLRLELWQEAEDALQHASRLDCNSPLVWGHLALLLLSTGEDRLQEADRALSQALSLGLADPSLLREIGNCYVAAGRLDAAEDALRKSLAADASGSSGGGGGGVGRGGVGNPHTRRCLADVLSARNSTSQALEEYRQILEFPDPDVDDVERQEVLARCGTLLRKMGRGDELDLLRKEALSSHRSQMLSS
eukprot:g16673.t1